MKNSQDQSPEIIINHWAEHFNNGNLKMKYLLVNFLYLIQ